MSELHFGTVAQQYPLTIYDDADATNALAAIGQPYVVGTRVVWSRIGKSIAVLMALADNAWTQVGTSGGGVIFTSGFSNFGSPYETARFIRDDQGWVHLAGLIVAAAAHTTAAPMFTLPAGYRPAADHAFPIFTGSNLGVFGNIRVLTDGTVEVYVSPAGNVSLDGISFLAEQ